MSNIQSFHRISEPGESPQTVAATINALLGLQQPLSLVAFDAKRHNDPSSDGQLEWSLQFRSGGDAAYTAIALSYDTEAGTTFEQQVAAYFAANTNLFPVVFVDTTPADSRYDTPSATSAIILCEEVADANDYPTGSQEFLTGRYFFVQTNEAIAIDAQGSVDILSAGSRTKTVTGATNKGSVSLALGDEALAFYEPITQSLWLYPTCC
jgi:hypothetical protein